MKTQWIEKIYAGWLAKIIGIRLGAPIEGWTYDAIQNMFGELWHYPVEYKNFAADDDSNGPLFFLRALEDSAKNFSLTAQDVGEALLNYAPYEHGFFWWGGYGVSTEHTAYLNLRSGSTAPHSGSIAQNGKMIAEQIGGQIFIDSWGLVTPGNPDLAADYAQKAASVTHDGNGIYGGIFVAVCISWAFVEQDLNQIIEKGLSYIPVDCEYTRAVRAVQTYHREHPENWRDCYEFIRQNFGYDRYPGNCHIIPNSAVMILALLYGEGDFSRTLNVCNMCGWDTDCNVGNIATIMGVRCGLDAIDAGNWRGAINDLLICSSVLGSMNIMDIPYGALYMVKLAYAIAGESLPEPWDEVVQNRIDCCHFEFAGSTHAIRVRTDQKTRDNQQLESVIKNSDETAAFGNRSLKIVAKQIDAGEQVYIYKQTYYVPEDFNDSRYDPSFSPLVYPGQTVHISVFLPEYAECGLQAAAYVRDSRTQTIYKGEQIQLIPGKWTNLTLQIPSLSGALLDEMGTVVDIIGPGVNLNDHNLTAVCLIDDLYVSGMPDYVLDCSKEKEEVWNVFHREVSQFSKLKGLLYLEEEQLQLSCSDFAECYTGFHGWQNYCVKFTITPFTGQWHQVNIRVQGAIRSYAVGLLPDGIVALLKNENGYRVLCKTDFAWETGKPYEIHCSVVENQLCAEVETVSLSYTDEEHPYLTGGIGLSVREGSHLSCKEISVSPIMKV